MPAAPSWSTTFGRKRTRSSTTAPSEVLTGPTFFPSRTLTSVRWLCGWRRPRASAPARCRGRRRPSERSRPEALRRLPALFPGPSWAASLAAPVSMSVRRLITVTSFCETTLRTLPVGQQLRGRLRPLVAVEQLALRPDRERGGQRRHRCENDQRPDGEPAATAQVFGVHDNGSLCARAGEGRSSGCVVAPAGFRR